MSFSFYRILVMLSSNKIRLPILPTYFFHKNILKATFEVTPDDTLLMKTEEPSETLSESIDRILSAVFSIGKVACYAYDKKTRYPITEKKDCPVSVNFIQEGYPFIDFFFTYKLKSTPSGYIQEFDGHLNKVIKDIAFDSAITIIRSISQIKNKAISNIEIEFCIDMHKKIRISNISECTSHSDERPTKNLVVSESKKRTKKRSIHSQFVRPVFLEMMKLMKQETLPQSDTFLEMVSTMNIRKKPDSIRKHGFDNAIQCEINRIKELVQNQSKQKTKPSPTKIQNDQMKIPLKINEPQKITPVLSSRSQKSLKVRGMRSARELEQLRSNQPEIKTAREAFPKKIRHKKRTSMF